MISSYRRNGKLWSCEACRKGKLACDHRRPVCSRCLKRGKADQCVYHPAPLTKPRTSTGSGVQRTGPISPVHADNAAPYPTEKPDSRRSGLASPLSSNDSQQFQANASSSYGTIEGDNSVGQSYLRSPIDAPLVPIAIADGSGPSSVCLKSPESTAPFRDSRTGFLGPTSYSAVYTENSTIIEFEGNEEIYSINTVSPEKLQQGASVLALLKDIPLFHKLRQKWMDYDGFVVPHPIFIEWMNSLWQQFGSVLEEGRPEALRSLARLVWENTQKPVKIHGSMSALEWARSVSGRNLRWEVVASILSCVGLVAINLSDWDAVFDSIREQDCDRNAFAERMRKASEHALCASYECEVLNETYCAALFLDLVLVEALKGDAHYAAWQRTGEVLDSVVAMGMHRGNFPDESTPFFMAELRKRLFMLAYVHDMVMASYLGRPPRASHRFCRMDLPLDLSDEQICAEGDHTELLRGLDSRGWNTRGQFHRMTWLRVLFQNTRVLEDILELALAPFEQTPEEILIQVESIRTKLSRLAESNPEFLKHSPEVMLNERLMRTGDGVFLLCQHIPSTLRETNLLTTF